jgi:hypothetical protein
MAISSTVLISLTPSWKALIILMSWMYEIAFSDVAEIFHVVPDTLITLLPDGLLGLYCRWTLICALEISDEHGA